MGSVCGRRCGRGLNPRGSSIDQAMYLPATAHRRGGALVTGGVVEAGGTGIPRSALGSHLVPWRGLHSGLGREMPAPAQGAEVCALGANEAAIRIATGNRSHGSHCGPTAGVRNFRALRHVDLLRLVALGGLKSCPVRGSRLIAVGHEGTSRFRLLITIANQARACCRPWIAARLHPSGGVLRTSGLPRPRWARR